MSAKGDIKSEKIVMKSPKGNNKGSAINCKEPAPKRQNSGVSPNSIVDEIGVMQHHIEGLSEDIFFEG